MKRLLTAVIVFTFLFATEAFAHTVINVPIDSRPVSSDYLKDLTELGGDDYVCVDKDNLDFFSAVDADNHFGNSKAVREELYNLVSQKNASTARVIINSSSYFTNGLVGSRCASNYSDYKQALDDLKKLTTDFKEPEYYVNLSMPRTLPETRFNQIWKDNTKDHGIGYFYLQHNPQAEDAPTIKNYYYDIEPIQLIMEYSYTFNKAEELGRENLAPWEKDFLDYFTKKYANKDPYRTYIEKYKLPYKTVAEIFGNLLEMEKQGFIDEIIVSNDDFQLPNSIVYFSGRGEEWASTVKYSFARTYMSSGWESIYNRLAKGISNSAKNDAIYGRGKKVNFIFGTDEVPQLIYARDLSKRKKLSTDINVITNDLNKQTGTYDINKPLNLANAAVKFTSYSINKTDKPFDLYLYDYNVKTNVKDFMNKMSGSGRKGSLVGLIELFASSTLNSGENTVFKTIKNGETTYLKLSDLDSYSAWNTNANAIGLGVAHSQVYGIMQQASTTPEKTAAKQFDMLVQHILEDGIYTIQTKRNLGNEGFVPSVEDRKYSQKLYDSFNFPQIKDIFDKAETTVNGKTFKVTDMELKNCCFPWGRTFDCFVDVDTTVKKIG